MLKRFRHREVFFAHNGPGPYVCVDCGVEVTFDDVAVHHVDHDHGNNDPANLAPMHGSCHMRHHARLRKGRKHGHPYANKGRPLAPEHVEALRQAAKRRDKGTGHLTDEHKAKIREGVKKSWEEHRAAQH